MTELSKKIIRKINEENIQPYSKWHFLFKRSVIWVLFTLSILLGTIASGLIIYQLQQAEWDLYPHFDQSLLEFILLILPYFWFIFLILFSILVYYYFRRTERGYRKNAVLIIIMSLLLSLMGGAFLNQTGFSEKVETVFEERVPFYRGMGNRKKEMWSSPEKGLLGGEIITILEEDKILINDFQDKTWTIDISQTILRGRITLQKNQLIKIIGEITGEAEFKADEIRRWLGRGQRIRKNPQNKNINR